MLDGVQWPSTRGNQITSRDARARIRTLQGGCVFCCHKCHTNSINHYVITVYIDFRNNISHFHAASPPQKLPKTRSSKQLFDLPSKTTRHFPQNDTMFSVKRHDVFSKTTRCFLQNDTWLSIKRHVTFHKTIRRFGDDEVFSIPSTVTLVTAKNKTRRTGARIHARVRTPFGQSPTIPSSNQTNQSTPPPFRIPSKKTFIDESAK